MCDPSYATGGTGSEITLVLDGGTGNQEIKKWLVKKGESQLNLVNDPASGTH